MFGMVNRANGNVWRPKIVTFAAFYAVLFAYALICSKIVARMALRHGLGRIVTGIVTLAAIFAGWYMFQLVLRWLFNNFLVGRSVRNRYVRLLFKEVDPITGRPV